MWSPKRHPPAVGQMACRESLHLFDRMLQPCGARDLLFVEKADGVEHEPACLGADQPTALQRAVNGARAELGLVGDLLDRAKPFRTEPDLVSHS